MSKIWYRAKYSRVWVNLNNITPIPSDMASGYASALIQLAHIQEVFVTGWNETPQTYL